MKENKYIHTYIHVLMDVEVLPHEVFQTDIAENHLELAEVSLDSI